MTEPQLRYVTCASPNALHRLAYWEWLPRGESLGTVVCVHGLTRTGRDFDALAERLSAKWRVVCPDMIGRGRSDRVDPQLYVLAQYVSDCVTLIARLDVEPVSWVGTSMGGLIGMLLAALRGAPIGRLVLNDIGPALDPAGRQRIADYVGADPTFASEAEGLAALRQLMRTFGPHTDEEFRRLNRHYLVRRDDRWAFHYDPAIAVPFRSPAAEPSNLWAYYDQVRCPTLVLRGAESDLLSGETAAEMSRRGPMARVVAFPGIGHAPTLMAEDQISAVERFLEESSS